MTKLPTLDHAHVEGTACAGFVAIGPKIIGCAVCAQNVAAFKASGAVSGEIVLGRKLLSTEPIRKSKPDEPKPTGTKAAKGKAA